MSVRALDATAADAGRTVQRFLHERLEVSNAEAKGLIATGCVARNGTTVARPDERIRAGDRVRVTAEPDRRYARAAPQRKGGEGWLVLHEDDDVLVVDKDAGILTVPTAAPAGDSLEEMVLESYRKRGHRKPSVHVVHRIDRFTSGLVVFARSHAAAMALKQQFADRSPERIYLAVVEGRVRDDRGRLTHVLAEHAKSLKVHVVAPGGGGRPASLRYRVVERFARATLLEVTLETGRRNQIRVQLAAEGHPVIGDVTYGTPSPMIPRVALHAQRLAFDMPRGPKRARFESPVPGDIRRLLALLREQDENAGVGEEVVRPAKRRDLGAAKETQPRNPRKVPRQRL